MIRAQSILQKVFGMELAELRAPIEPDDLTQKDKDGANGKKKGASREERNVQPLSDRSPFIF